MEVYARTGAEVIIEDQNPYYLKSKKVEKPPIRFQNIIKVEPNIFKKKKNVLFGLELPKEEDLFSDDSDVILFIYVDRRRRGRGRGRTRRAHVRDRATE